MLAQSFSFSVPRLAFTARTFALVTPQPLRMAPSTAASSVLVETLLRALPASSALPPGKVCALEALEVFKAAGIPTPFTDPAGLGFGAMFLGFLVFFTQR